jgi:hypothetical protein
MKLSGRVSANTLIFAGLAFLVGMIVLIVTTKRGPSTSAAEFLQALAKADAPTVARLSIIDDDDYETRLKKWQATLDRTEYYLWSYKILNTVLSSDKTANVRVEVIKNPTSSSPVIDKFELPMEKSDGEWKVVVPLISREMYPSLPE